MAEKVQTIKEIHQNLSQMFEKLYSAGEAKSLATLIIGEFTGLGRARQLASGHDTPAEDLTMKIAEAAQRVALGEPYQYVLGYTTFCGQHIKLSPAVLIPRPETEELTAMIIGENSGFNGTIVDYCTGSGCIATALAAAFPSATLHATDISPEALLIAEDNALLNKAAVTFLLSDLLITEAEKYPTADIIVSNPPYVRESEKSLMQPNVLDHEPEAALFVPDSDPLRFYRKLAEIASVTLNAGGKVYLEINEALGEPAAELFLNDRFKEVRVIKDLFGRDRFIKAERR